MSIKMEEIVVVTLCKIVVGKIKVELRERPDPIAPDTLASDFYVVSRYVAHGNPDCYAAVFYAGHDYFGAIRMMERVIAAASSEQEGAPAWAA